VSEKYHIVKFYDAPGKRPRVQRKMGKLSLADAQRICSDPATSTNESKPCGKNWFLGYRRV
jgi:hypothetical protein